MPPVGIQADWKRFNLPATITIYRPVHVHITSVTENQNAREDEASVSSPEQQLGNENPPTDEEGDRNAGYANSFHSDAVRGRSNSIVSLPVATPHCSYARVSSRRRRGSLSASFTGSGGPAFPGTWRRHSSDSGSLPTSYHRPSLFSRCIRGIMALFSLREFDDDRASIRVAPGPSISRHYYHDRSKEKKRHEKAQSKKEKRNAARGEGANKFCVSSPVQLKRFE
jgi:hypothetical protein